MKLLAHLTVVVAAFAALHGSATAQSDTSPAEIVRGVLSQPDDRLDYGRAKLAFDRIVDPSLNADAALAEIDRLAGSASALAGADASPAARLSALRRVIYESGDWNGRRPFAYDHADARAERPQQADPDLPRHPARQLRVDADPLPDRG
jgi:hypothetical protein